MKEFPDMNPDSRMRGMSADATPVDDLIHAAVLLYILGLGFATVVGRGREYLAATERLVIAVVFWPVRSAMHLGKQMWRWIGKQVGKGIVHGAASLWNLVWRW
jgi:hypothetical protein